MPHGNPVAGAERIAAELPEVRRLIDAYVQGMKAQPPLPEMLKALKDWCQDKSEAEIVLALGIMFQYHTILNSLRGQLETYLKDRRDTH